MDDEPGEPKQQQETINKLVVENPQDSHINIYALLSFHSLASFLMWIKLLYFMRIFKQTGKNDWAIIIFLNRLSCENYYRLYLWHESLPLNLHDSDHSIQWGLSPDCWRLQWCWWWRKVLRKDLCIGICLYFCFGSRWYACRRLWWQCCTCRGLDHILSCSSYYECRDAELTSRYRVQVFRWHQQ